MNQTSGRSAAPPLDAETEDHTTSSLKGDGLSKNHIVHKSQVDPALCASLAPSLLHKTQNSFSDSLSVKIDLDLASASPEEEEEDSGLADASIKASSSLKTSVGFSDSTYDDSEDDRPGSFDYMPCQSDHVRIKHSFNPRYDEEVKVDSSTGDSSVESPRSETSVTHDEYNVADEGTEMSTLSYKETPHQPFAHEHKHIHHVWDYTQKHSDDESMEDEEEERSRVLGTSYKASSSRQVEVDDGISYNLKPLGSYHLGRQFTMTPCGPYVEQYKSDGSKEKKDKKKRKSKDDSDKPEVPGLVDINGNPSLPEPANYSQMRQLPRGKSDSFASVSLASSSSSPNSQTCNSSSASEINKLDRKKERKRMKLEKQKWTPAEAYEDHKDFQDIKEILDFVEGLNSSSRSEGKSVKKKQERSKKKDQHSKLDDAAGGEDGPGLATIVTAAARPDAEAMGNSSVKSLAEDDDDDDSKTDSAHDNLDKYSEFHDCLNTLPTEHIISDGSSPLQVDKPEKVAKTISSNLSEPEKINPVITKDNNKIDSVLTDNNKSVSKKSTKAKSKKEKQDTCRENGPLSPKVKPKESLEMNNPMLAKTSSTNEDANVHNVHSSNEKEMLLELKREDSFTEVKKRKKRVGGKDSSIALSNHSSSLHYHQHSESGHSHRNNLRPVTGTPPPSSTPGAVTVTYSSSSLPIIDQTRSSRDLSPSAFPVLSGHAPLPALHKEARRNSCGDLTTDSIDSKTYDSDRESAKSLPDAHGVRVCGDMSPIYPVSYARMVAAPRRNDSTNSPSSESGVVSGSQNSSVNSSITHTPGSSSDIMSPQPTNSIVVIQERKATVWKGSPRERRHSIGSSPDDKIEGDKSSVTQRNRQCGSQEVLSRDCSASTASQSTRASSTMPVKITPTIEGSIVLTHTEQQDIVHPAAPNIPSSQSATKLPVQQSAKTAASEHATLSFVSSNLQESLSATQLKESTIIPAREKANEVTAAHIAAPDLSKTKNEASGAVDSGLRAMLVPSKNKTASVPPNSARKNSGSTNNTKSVIFLDKRFDASLPQSLGITFGFDSSFESITEPTTSQSTGAQQSSHPPNQQSALVTVFSSSSSQTTSSVCSSAQQQPLPCPTAHPHIPQTAPSSSMPAVSTTSSLQSSDNSNNIIVPKDPHIQGPSNGIILPSNPAILSEKVTSSSSSSGISTCKDDNNISSISSDRTNSQLQTESQVNNHNKSSTANSGPLILPVLQGTSPVLQANGPLAQLSKSTQHMITLNSSVTITRANPAGVTYSLNYPPPPISQAVVTATGDNSNSTSALPSAQDKPEPNPANNKSNSASTEPGTLNSSIIMKDPPGGSETSPPVASAAPDISSAAETAAQQHPQQQQLCSNAVPAEVLQSAMHVVYGEKIKSGAGCGRLLFVPNELPQKNKGNAAEIGHFLRRRWFEEVQQKKGSGIFHCCD